MKTEFPLLDRLIISGVVPPPIPGMKLVSIQEASDQYYYDAKDIWDWDKDFGPLTPPYMDMWMESTARLRTAQGDYVDVRQGFYLKCEKRKTDGAFRVNKLLTAHPDTEFVYSLYGFFDSWDPKFRAVPHAVSFLEVSKDGQYIKGTLGFDTTAAPEEDRLNATNILHVAGKSAFFALAMMNCKNVSVESKMTRVIGSKKQRRKRRPSVEYHVIHLPRPKSATGASQATGTRTTRLHTARGHFKTYTEDAPLMGKVTGTYYWAPQVRGRAENGEIISTYKVGASA